MAAFEVIQAPAETAELTGSFDGALMFAAPEVFAVEAALNNILPRLNRGARIAFFGEKISHHPLGRILNPVLRFLASKLSPQTPVPGELPWQQLSQHMGELEIREYALGSMFVGHGKVREKAPDNSFKPAPLRGAI